MSDFHQRDRAHAYTHNIIYVLGRMLLRQQMRFTLSGERSGLGLDSPLRSIAKFLGGYFIYQSSHFIWNRLLC